MRLWLCDALTSLTQQLIKRAATNLCNGRIERRQICGLPVPTDNIKLDSKRLWYPSAEQRSILSLKQGEALP